MNNQFLQNFMKMRAEIVGKEKTAEVKALPTALGKQKEEPSIRSLARDPDTTKKQIRSYFLGLRDKLQDEADAKDV
jgi:hypothetical protein